MTGDEETHYELLGVAPDATPDEIKRAGRRLMQKHHPDRGGSEAAAAAVNTAVAVLSNPIKRKEYDEFLRTGGESAEPETPDPDSYEDAWGTTDEWANAEEEEELDVEVEDDPPEQPPAPEPDSDPQDTPNPPDTPDKATKVRTALWRALVLGLLPTLVLNLAVFAESYLITDAGESWLLFPSIGAAVGLLIPLVLRQRLPQTPRSQVSIAAMTTSIVLVVGMAFIAPENPLVIPALQSLLATGLGLWVFVANATHHRLAERIISSKGLREDGTLFGPSSGDTSGELLTTTLWNCMSQPGMHAARSFQTADTENPFTKSVLLGNRLALIRPVFIPDDMIPVRSPAFYWSPPSLFLRSSDSGVPTPILRLDLTSYRASFKNLAGELTVSEFIIVYTTPGAPKIAQTPDNPLMPALVMGPDASDAICEFLLGGKNPTHHVDHVSAANALMGLEYRLMNS